MRGAALRKDGHTAKAGGSIAKALPVRRAPALRRTALGEAIALRSASLADADAIHALILDHLAEGHLLPRDREEIARHAHRFVVAVQGMDIVACAELAPLSRTVSEVRSLVVSREARSRGVGTRLVRELVRRAESAGFERLAAFSHAPAYFVHMGFSLVPHSWLPEKIATDCQGCPSFRRCGQHAVVLPLARPSQACVPLTSLHG